MNYQLKSNFHAVLTWEIKALFHCHKLFNLILTSKTAVKYQKNL